jgi:nitrile hydratase subunit beta
MDSLHALGGKQGFGRVVYPWPPHDETWEPTVRALSACALRNHIYNMDEMRHAIERRRGTTCRLLISSGT